MAEISKDKALNDAVLSAAAEKISMYQSEVYNKLKSDGLLDTFLELVEKAGALQLDVKHAHKYINESMGNYFKNNELSGKTFELLLDRYPDVRKAWCKSRATEISKDNIVKMASSQLMLALAECKDIDKLMMVLGIVDDEGKVSQKNKPDYAPARKSINVSIDNNSDNNNSKTNECEQLTYEQMKESMKNLDDDLVQDNHDRDKYKE